MMIQSWYLVVAVVGKSKQVKMEEAKVVNHPLPIIHSLSWEGISTFHARNWVLLNADSTSKSCSSNHVQLDHRNNHKKVHIDYNRRNGEISAVQVRAFLKPWYISWISLLNQCNRLYYNVDNQVVVLKGVHSTHLLCGR